MGKKKSGRKGQNKNKGKGSGKPTTNKDNQAQAPVDQPSDNVPQYKGNHYEYYNGYPDLLEASAKVVTSQQLGNVSYIGNPQLTVDGVTHNVRFYDHYECFPGIMRISVLYGPGYSVDANSAVNRAATDLHMYVASKRSSAIKNYDSASLIMMVNALDSAIVWFSLLKRLYYSIKKNSPYNLYYRYAFVTAQGFDFDEIKDNLPALANIIDNFSISMARYQIPKFYIQERHRWMFENYFCDDDLSNNPKAQLFFYRPSGIYFLDEDNISDRGITRLTYKDWAHMVSDDQSVPILGLNHIATICDKFTSMLNYSSDFYMIMSDIMNAYDSADMVTWDFIDTSDIWDPIFDEDAIIQLHNATICGYPGPNEGNDILQVYNTGDPSWYIQWNPYHGTEVNAGSLLKLSQLPKLDFLKEPDTEMITRSSRLTCAFRTDAETDPTGYPGANGFICGTEIVTGVRIFSYQIKESGLGVDLIEANLNEIATSQYANIDKLTDYTLAPRVYMHSHNTLGSVTTHSYYEVWNVHNYAYVPASTLYMLHRACTMSEWRVKEVENLKW